MLVLSATRGAANRLRGNALDTLASDGGVGRDRIPIAPGSVSFEDRGKVCVRAQNSHVGSVSVSGVDDDSRARASLGVAVDAWRMTRASVVHSMGSTASASLDQLASAGSFLLQQYHGRVASFTACGRRIFVPRAASSLRYSGRHWFGDVKKFPAISLSLRVLSPGSPVCVPRRADLSSDLAYGNHPSVALRRTMTSFTIRFAQTLSTGVPWFLTFLGVGCRLWPLSSNANFVSSTITRLRSRAPGPALMTIPTPLPRHLASLVTCCVAFCCGCCFCDSGTVIPLGSSCAVRMSRMPFSRFRSTRRGH